MSIQLRQAIGTDARAFEVAAKIEGETFPLYVTAGSEHIRIVEQSIFPIAGRTIYRVTAERGIAGTSRAEHAADAVLTPYYPDAPGGGGATPTLAEVLAAGNDPGLNVIQAAADGGAFGANLQVAAGLTPNGGDVTYAAGLGASGGGGAHIYTSGGQDADGGDIAIAAGDGVNGGKVTINGGYSDEDGALVVIKGATLTTPGYIFLNLPTSDPAVAGALWNDALVVKVSAG